MWNLSSNISINKYQPYSNTISDREIHVNMGQKFKTLPDISNIYKGQVQGTAQFNTI